MGVIHGASSVRKPVSLSISDTSALHHKLSMQTDMCDSACGTERPNFQMPSFPDGKPDSALF